MSASAAAAASSAPLPVPDASDIDTTDFDSVDVSIGEIGKQFPRIVDVSWRLSLITNTSTAKKVYEPTYLVQLTVSDGGKLKDVQFQCNAEEMNDFVQKLKEATAQVERTTAINQ